MLKNQSETTSSILKGQKPLKKKKTSSVRHVLFFSAFLLFSYVFYHVNNFKPSVSIHSAQKLSLSTIISANTVIKVHCLEDQSECPTFEDIYKKNSFDLNDITSRKKLYFDLVENTNYTDIKIVKLHNEEYHLFLRFLEPILIASLDVDRFVDHAGNVFNRASSEDLDLFPKVYGLENDIASKTKRLDSLAYAPNIYKMPTILKQKIKAALNLYDTLASHNFSIKSISYIKFRGFSVQLNEHNANYIFGYPPYEKKFQKFEKIINSEKSMLDLSLVELDFADKAIIKKKVETI